jgi:aspartyl-tRNA(Asn)/glutamyl-tRNA(Gln) amidotransferase subunit B
MVENNKISLNAGKTVLNEIFEQGGEPTEIVSRLSLAQVSDEAELMALAREVLSENEKSVADYKNGKSNALGFLVGQCMRRSKGKGNPQILNKLLKELLD